MATLTSVKGHLTILGIVPISEDMLPSLLHPLITVINFVYPLCWFLSVLTYNITVVCFVLFEAETFIEFAECGFYCSVSFLHVVSYAILYQTRLELFALFKDSDEMVRKSKLELYWTKNFFFILFFLLWKFTLEREQKSEDATHVYSGKWKNNKTIRNSSEVSIYICWTIFISKCRTIILSILYHRFRSGCISIEFVINVILVYFE